MPAKLCPVCKAKKLAGKHKDACQKRCPGFWLVYYATMVSISRRRGSECSYVDDLSSAIISWEEYKKKLLRDPVIQRGYNKIKSQIKFPDEVISDRNAVEQMTKLAGAANG